MNVDLWIMIMIPWCRLCIMSLSEGQDRYLGDLWCKMLLTWARGMTPTTMSIRSMQDSTAAKFKPCSLNRKIVLSYDSILHLILQRPYQQKSLKSHSPILRWKSWDLHIPLCLAKHTSRHSLPVFTHRMTAWLHKYLKLDLTMRRHVLLLVVVLVQKKSAYGSFGNRHWICIVPDILQLGIIKNSIFILIIFHQ